MGKGHEQYIYRKVNQTVSNTQKDAKYSYKCFQIYYPYFVIMEMKCRLSHMLGKHSTSLIFKFSYQYSQLAMCCLIFSCNLCQATVRRTTLRIVQYLADFLILLSRNQQHPSFHYNNKNVSPDNDKHLLWAKVLTL